MSSTRSNVTSAPGSAARRSTTTTVPGTTFSCRPPASTIANMSRLLNSTDALRPTRAASEPLRVAFAGCHGQDVELLQQDSGALDLLGAERVEEPRQQLVHQLEVGRERGSVLTRRVEHFLAEPFGVQLLAGSAVDEDELRNEGVAFLVDVGPYFVGDSPAG